MNTLNLYAKNIEIKEKNGEAFYLVRKIEKPEKNEKLFYNTAKRIFDVFAGLMAAIVLFIPCCIVALAIYIDDPGPVFYTQERLGKNEKPFMLRKFRSMYTNAEENGAVWASENDERCTPVGRFLRATRIDELPQLLNIIKGDMSIVGPRPERPCFYDEFDNYIEGFRQRLYITPGLTGLAQVNGGYELKPEEKIAYDLEYIETRSFWLDIKLIFKTILIVFNHKGAR